jgi:hypothetical protein
VFHYKKKKPAQQRVTEAGKQKKQRDIKINYE